MGDVIRIIIAEPSTLIREGLMQVLKATAHQFYIHKVDSLEQIWDLQQRHTIDVVCINPGIVLQAPEQISRLRSSMEAASWGGIVYSYYDPRLLSQFNFLLHITDEPNVIVDTILQAANYSRQAENSSQHALSDREIDVLRLLVAGKSNKEIADALNISVHTVISHRKNISVKTGIKSVSGLTIFAVVKNLINVSGF
ncbi:MAG: response regulator transcription factor [Ignavibacteria bacterium]|nr:response regulator transcription factor [Ignavibacteria bacterium]